HAACKFLLNSRFAYLMRTPTRESRALLFEALNPWDMGAHHLPGAALLSLPCKEAIFPSTETA
ncbi:hypothetical protein ABXW85_21835, partial [Streptococcus suis]